MMLLRFENNEIRADVRDDSPWFVLTDVAKALDLKNVQNFLKSSRCQGAGVAQAEVTDEVGRLRPTTVVSERNLYALVARSDKAEALRFMDWVFGSVLPSIRRTGTYTAGEQSALPARAVEATEWLAALLADRARPFLEVKELSRAEGYPRRTLFEAKDALGVRVTLKAARKGKATAYWSLPRP